MDVINVGMIGFGTVGTGVAHILEENGAIIEKRLGAKLYLKKIADIDLEKDRGISIDKERLTKDSSDVIDDPEIAIVMELIGGYEPAKTLILQAIENGKHVVTANKALLASHGNEIFQRAREKGVDVAFEGSVGGGIPVLRSLREGLVANTIRLIYGIMNGTSNYILTEMTERGQSFGEVLERAKELGYAEADPTFDIEGIDTAHKLCIIISMAYGIPISLNEIYTEGISKITPLDIAFAKEFGYKIKLLALSMADGDCIEARVHPTMIPIDSQMAHVNGVFNAFYIEGDEVGATFFYGLGAGMMPTGSAVVGDLVELGRNVLNRMSCRVPSLSYRLEEIAPIPIKPIEDIRTNYYLRFSALDRPGVLSKISGILGRYGISILSVVQKGRQIAGGAVPLVMMTHEAEERGVRKALSEIDELPITADDTMVIRIEDKVIQDTSL